MKQCEIKSPKQSPLQPIQNIQIATIKMAVINLGSNRRIEISLKNCLANISGKSCVLLNTLLLIFFSGPIASAQLRVGKQGFIYVSPKEEWQTCKKDSDCSRVETDCGTCPVRPDAVNLKHVEDYSGFRKIECSKSDKPTIGCFIGHLPEGHARCNRKKCTFVPKSPTAR